MKDLPELKLIVAGGREFADYQRMTLKLIELASFTYYERSISIVSGMARGADALAVRFAREHSVKLYEYPADWNQYGKRAGFLRNTQMAQEADALLAFWDGKSRGTEHMVRTMRSLGKPVHLERY